MIDPKDETKYVCLLCTGNTSDLKDLTELRTSNELAKLKSILRDCRDEKKLTTLNIYWLRRHLETKMHFGFTKSENRPKLEDDVASLGRHTAEKDLQTDLTKTDVVEVHTSLNSDEKALQEIFLLSRDMEGKLCNCRRIEELFNP